MNKTKKQPLRPRGSKEAYWTASRTASRYSRGILGILSIFVLQLGGVHAGDLARGKVLFQYCVTCHGDDAHGKQAGTLRIPAIAGFNAWYVEAQLTKFQQNLRGAHPADTSGLLMRAVAKTL